MQINVAAWDGKERGLPFAFSTIRHDSWQYKLHKHVNFFELVCVHEGGLRQEVNGRIVEQGPRTICMIRENDSHELWGESFVMTNLMVSTWWVRQLEKLWGSKIIQSHLFGAEVSPVAHVGGDTWRWFESNLHRLSIPGSSAAKMALFSQFFHNLMMDHFIDGNAFSGEDEVVPEWISELQAWIAGQGDRPVRVEDVVEKANRCPEHVSRSFRKYLGLSPSQYLNQQRLEKAGEMLRSTSLPILDICYAVGFDNPSYFHRLFRKAHGITPNAYRKEFSIFRRIKS
ncbi:MAG: helix-turn-helix transcriptional regulator [Planctomycetes bacterium]|nr:helix-turn-helix transcriptional regulator [Planctomycetota bacterium]